MIRILFLMFWSFVIIFVICEFGELVTNQFDMFNMKLDQCKWYKFPIKMQRIFVIVTVNAQQPVIIQGFANVVCARQTFKSVRMIF